MAYKTTEISYFCVAPIPLLRSIPILTPKMKRGPIKKVLDFIPIFLFFLEMCNIEKFVPRNPFERIKLSGSHNPIFPNMLELKPPHLGSKWEV